jgi:hypothetical protein
MPGKRVTDRRKRRMPCEVLIAGRKHSGLVLDLSRSGLFIQTNAKTRPGQQFDLRISTGVGDPIGLVVEVVRRKVVPPRLLALAQGGVGVRVKESPEAYYAFLGDLGMECESTHRFRVRVKQISGPRTRTIEIESEDQSAAEEKALEELGDGWKVLDAAPL